MSPPVRPKGVLRSVRELEQFRVRSADGRHCGRIKDVYFDDLTWELKHVVLSIEPSVFGRKEVLLSPPYLNEVSDEGGVITLSLVAEDLERLSPAGSVMPVCKQYESFAYASPGTRRAALKADPHLRSVKAVMRYKLDLAGHFGGTLADLLFDSDHWDIRYLAVEQRFDGKTMRCYILPKAVERITWATQRVVLRNLNPVAVEAGEGQEGASTKAAA